MSIPTLEDADYAALADFRFELRQFLQFSEQAALAAGLTAQQHQALLALRAAPKRAMLIGELADRLSLRPHSTTELVDRLVRAHLAIRIEDEKDRRRVHVTLSDEGVAVLASLTASHRAELRRMKPMLAALIEKL